MKKIKFFALASAMFGLLLSVSTSTSASSLSLKVNDVYANSKSITGTATKGVDIVVRDASKKTIATSKASAKTGNFNVKLDTKLTNNEAIKVYARQSSTKFFYRVLHVKANQVATKSTATKTTTKKAPVKVINQGVSPMTPNGTWKSGFNHGYNVVYKFDDKTGFNQYIFKGNKAVKKLVNYATFKVTVSKTDRAFWKIEFQPKGQKDTQKMYIRFNSHKQFIVVDAHNKPVQVKYANLPASYYKVNLQK